SYVILHNVSKKHNVGTISRCATAFNVTQICLVGSNRFNAFGSHGSDAHVDFGWHASIEACCQELREEKGAQIVGVEIVPSALPVHSFPFRGPTAFMLGNEVRKLYVVGRVDVSQPAVAGPPMPLPPASASQGQGLSERQIRNCDAFIYIPQYGAGTASLNVAVAASIVLHHFALWAGFPERGREGQKFIVAPRPQSARGKGAFDYLEDRLSILVAWEDRMQNAFAILSGDQPDTATSKSRKNRKKAVQTAPAEPRVFKPAEEVFAVSDDFMQVRGRSQGKGRAESGIKAGGRMPTTAELETAAASADPSTRPALISDWLSQISSPNASAAQTFKEALAGGTALDALLASFLASPGSEAEADALARLVAAAAHETCPPGVPSSLVAMLRALGSLHASDPLGGLPAAPRALAALVDTLRRQLAEVQARLAAREGALAAAGVATGGSEGLGGAPGAQPDGHGHATRDAGRADPLPNGGHEAVPGSVQEETAGARAQEAGGQRAELEPAGRHGRASAGELTERDFKTPTNNPIPGRDTTDDFLVEDVVAPERPAVLEHETDPHRLAQRQKQVDFGKNTLGYQRYREAIPRSQRRRNKDPSTPDVHKACSKRAFDGQIKKWRRQLHEWDPPTQEAGAADDVALATGAVMSLEAAGPAGREEPAPGGLRRREALHAHGARDRAPAPRFPTLLTPCAESLQDGQVIPGSKKGRELRGSGRLLPRLFGRSGTNKRRPDLGSQEGAGGQPDPRATKRGWFTATRASREAVQAEPGMPEVDYRYWQGRQGGWIWAGSCSRLSHRLNAP
ncbi:hypothetical protein APUTEX25_002086, partial [Auxenochlorella protothecoides]